MRTFVIAEAGVNHNGSLDMARRLIDAAAAAGADAVKFQTFRTENLACREAPKACYQESTTDRAESQFAMLKRLELSPGDHRDLMQYCRTSNIAFLSSPFDLDSIDLLDELGLDLLKIPSGEITNLPFLKKIGALNKKLILSTGMSTMEEIAAALKVLIDAGANREQIIVLHANTEYPTPFADVNLRAMTAIRQRLGVAVGYSDHTPGIEIPIAAVALGAEVIEKHFTLDRNLPGPDHKASLEPQELKAMIVAIRHIESALGDGVKRPSPSEAKNMAIARKSIVASKDIKQGEPFTCENIAVKRPGTGISPMKWDLVLGRTAPRSFKADDLIEL